MTPVKYISGSATDPKYQTITVYMGDWVFFGVLDIFLSFRFGFSGIISCFG